jgi:Cytochrome c554 and c-prime
MAHALEAVKDSKVLVDHPVLTTKQGRYSYRIERRADQSVYSVSDGYTKLEMMIKWVMGASSAIGQTYILERDGQLYESRVSYFSELNGLGPTLGSEGSAPGDLSEAAGRLMGIDDKLRCFGCHATNAATGRKLTLETLTPGVQCGRCHDSLDTHLAAVLLNRPELGFREESGKSPPLWSAERVSSFCGQCHRTWEEISLQGVVGVANVRFQPYRLAGSKCYDPDDSRVGCLACHDPHREVSSRVEDYDRNCLACHGGGKAGAKSCRAGTERCVSCHMPKIELPGAHHKFSDHRIRIVRANEKYPG